MRSTWIALGLGFGEPFPSGTFEIELRDGRPTIIGLDGPLIASSTLRAAAVVSRLARFVGRDAVA